MLGKNNYAELVKKYADSKQRFAIRRIGLVTVSVLLGLMFSGGHMASADELGSAFAQPATVASSNGEATEDQRLVKADQANLPATSPANPNVT
ncbi:hypothetical protein [Ligilactobacillus saerimneri]|uniref:hypothetical protein n=1 Tax=Ligilactobacillus saerimneri TaxID=228229 RepID=UPI001C1281D3|nr:hypothetical protein [Ligilactobacillus saerimneri]MBU5309337.1 hypothetical protein [Ligilactobacillus saerimneri]MDY4003673.1 hypothetical protein [Ligilactobacillus saerimneri]HJF29182.1 hypothetical protein [Ligilactobacillus saerimneri]